MSKDLAELVFQDPGNPAFVDLAESLRTSGKLSESLQVCLAGLSRNPDLHRGRLVLARVFFELGFVPFCLQEIHNLIKELPNNNALLRLAEKLDPSFESSRLNLNPDSARLPLSDTASSNSQADESVVAEADFDFDILDGLNDEEKA